jgi:hypothetical protein
VTDGLNRAAPELSHRDLRAIREVDRSFWTVAAILVVLTVLALEVPIAVVGLSTLLALVALGAIYLGWADRFLTSYAGDLRRARSAEGTGEGFLRAEGASSHVRRGDSIGVRSRSPHLRRRSPPSEPTADDAPLGTRPGSD